jgi:predicted dehydrogenase
MNKLKVGIIGIGHLGSRHLVTYQELEDIVEIVGVCDIKPERVKILPNAPRHIYSNYKELLGKVDAVNICVPTESHFEVAKFFLENKVHTFIEKPITTTEDQAQILIDLAEKNNVKLQVGHIERFNTAFESIKHFTHDPLFIECHRLNHFPNRSLDIGVVMDLMIHDIDIILGIIKSPLKDISAVGVNVLTAREDIASVRLTFENGCVCNLTASRISDEVMRKIRIFEKNTYISLDYVKQEAFIYRKHENQILKHALPIEKEQPLKRELEHFVDCVMNNKTPIVSGIEGKKALVLALKITELIWKNLQKTL